MAEAGLPASAAAVRALPGGGLGRFWSGTCYVVEIA
jgi:hypothetical protein